MSTYSIFLFAFSLFLSFYSHFNICVAYTSEEDNYDSIYAYDESSGRGPSQWGNLNESWYLCGNGTSQSPINISRLQFTPNLGALQTQYKPAQATLINRGHDISVKWNGDAGGLNINGTNYTLMDCHWHTPSEHTINGRRFDLELHIVHENSLNETTVVGILYRYGLPNPFLSTLYDQIRSLDNNTNREIPLGIINPYSIGFANNTGYYRYNGSLTTPPCYENVLWTLLTQIQTVSLRQVQALKEAVNDGYEENARPIQPINGRTVYLYPRSLF
ncbi:hypothetical protein CsatB_016223 [Cannabis sativa]|uniref:alpha carbonic anhydrase 4 n=1 Tax=Cannabis sativa TaxID=3483 RepID=UPI0029CA5935|nr:alpha carbonic anhydrase 4 [Cannabis sativa]